MDELLFLRFETLLQRRSTNSRHDQKYGAPYDLDSRDDAICGRQRERERDENSLM